MFAFRSLCFSFFSTFRSREEARGGVVELDHCKYSIHSLHHFTTSNHNFLYKHESRDKKI